MPKISAATVVEHRAHQRAALLDAARALLLSGGYSALTFRALAERTGLARPTVYSYFKTRDDVVVALCATELPAVATATELAVRQATDPPGRLAAFVQAQLSTGHNGQYRIANALTDAPLSTEARHQIGALHRDLMPSAAGILADLGHSAPEVAAALLQGLMNAAVTAIDAGAPVAITIDLTIHIALSGFPLNSR